ncbi:hypothetical protein [Oribacterium sp. WCC10]|uniref:hypothetical protein n=1 Tax=Oribacterium sp. WCC10 TaxID=1855343 RepID=UPI0008F34A78|nr:hypothetical protein [Oribacterium sp. WCC10]SFG45825.1 hypothetical protein SAMN05216356_10981 [Oribacterium sp. WCC10]
MKKLLAVMLTFCMLMCNIVAFADEVVELNWSDVVALDEESGDDIISKGRFVNFDEVDCKMWIPNSIKEVELTADDKEDGYIGYYESKNQDCAVAVVYVNTGLDLEEYLEALKKTDGVEYANYIKVNGNTAISYDMPDDDTSCLAFETENGYILEFSFAPTTGDKVLETIGYMGCSIMPGDGDTTGKSK